MPVHETSYDCKRLARVLRICPTAATRKMTVFDGQLSRLIEASLALQPDLHPYQLARQLAAAMRTGGLLALDDEQALVNHILEMATRSAAD